MLKFFLLFLLLGIQQHFVLGQNDCPTLALIDNGDISPSSATSAPSPHGTEVTFSCDDNFYLDGKSSIECVSGSWSAASPTCKAGM